MFLINYLFSSFLRRDSFKQFNRIAILVLKYSITLHIKSFFAQKHPAKGRGGGDEYILSCAAVSFLMCSGNISLHGGLLHISNITQIFQIFIFFLLVF